MTALDDALASNSILWGVHKIRAFWREVDNGDIATNPDAVGNLCPQMTNVFAVTQSLDDGLPDPVTMTSGNDASGVLGATLNGKEGLALGSGGVRTFDATASTTGTATKSIVCTIPTTAVRGDYLVTAVLVNSSTASLLQTFSNNDPKNGWTFLGSRVAGAGLAIYAYGARGYFPGRSPLTLTSDTSVNFIALTMPLWAANPSGIPLDYRMTDIQSASETVSGTSHTISSNLRSKGYQIGVFASASAVGPWSYPAGGSEWAETVAGAVDLMMSVSPLRDSGITALNGVTTSATAVAAMMSISLEPYQRPRMDARQYFSPFNPNSPIYGFDRDTAPVDLTFNVITATGPVGTTLFNGIMQDTRINGRQTDLVAASKTRIDLNTSVTLPVVFAYREGCTTDWLASWLLSRGGKFIGPAPTVYTRAWATMHGSVHPHISSPYTYNYTTRYDAAGGPWGYKNPISIAGPFSTAMYAQQSSTEIKEVIQNWIRPDLTDTVLPYYQPDSAGNTSPVYNDIFSQAANKGRLTLWLRGDAIQVAPSYTGAGNDLIFQYWMRITALDGSTLGTILINVRSVDRAVTVRLGSTAAGDTNFVYASLALPTDGLWHFYGFHWDFSLGKFDMIMDSTEVHTTSFLPTAATAQLPVTDAQGRALGHVINTQVRSHVPIAEYMWDVPPAYVAGQWDNWKTPVAPGATVTTRPTYQWLQAIAEPTPVSSWDTLAALAQSTMSAYRANEDDKYELLPPTYFGETAQMTPSTIVLDTQTNTQDLEVQLDPSKSRNVVTIQFPETSVTTNPNPILEVTQALAIPRGLTYFTFTLDTLTAEIHGQSTPFGAIWQLTNLTSSQITTPSLPANVHFMSVNTAADGGGTVLPFNKVSATIQYGDAATITILFNNQSGTTAYLSNNGQGVPFMRLLGYAVSVNDGYVTVRDPISVSIRKERGLTTQMDWIHTRDAAGQIAAQMVTALARPRTEVDVTVMGDPRRRPGQLVTIADSEGTAAAGTWRILSVGHNNSGPQYTQDLGLVFVAPIAVWDNPNTTWDNSVWGA